MRACIIGAGAAGLAAARHTILLPEWETVVYEQSDQIGGVWVYEERKYDCSNDTGWQSCMYKNLKTNLPKELMAYPDFPFPNNSLPSYISHWDVKKYLQSYADHLNLHRYIKFKHEVVKIEKQAKGWLVVVKDLATMNNVEELFDAIFVCNGHYSKPYIPSIRNSDQFRGRQFHSCLYQIPEEFSNQTVAILGGGPSGTDIAIQISKYADKVYFCQRGSPFLECRLPSNLLQVPSIREFTQDGILLDDDSNMDSVPVDVVIYCTGYNFHFPFLSKDIVSTDGWRVSPLYQHLVSINEPTLYFIGLCHKIVPFPFSYAQAKFCTALLSGKFELPSKEEMLESERKDYEYRRVVLEMPHKQAHLQAGMQWNYLKTLAEIGNFQSPVPHFSESMLIHAFESRKKDAIGCTRMKYKVTDEGFEVIPIE